MIQINTCIYLKEMGKSFIPSIGLLTAGECDSSMIDNISFSKSPILVSAKHPKTVWSIA